MHSLQKPQAGEAGSRCAESLRVCVDEPVSPTWIERLPGARPSARCSFRAYCETNISTVRSMSLSVSSMLIFPAVKMFAAKVITDFENNDFQYNDCRTNHDFK